MFSRFLGQASRRLQTSLGLVCLGWVLTALPGARSAASEAEAGTAPAEASPDLNRFLSDHCVSCHGREKQRGDLDLERFLPSPSVVEERGLWEKVRQALVAREMPPDNRPQPGEALRQSVVAWLDTEFERADAAAPTQPGAVTVRRLNRNEYRNTVRDLLGVDFDTREVFPTDESGYGFGNIGDVLSLPPMLLEKYLAAAETIAG
ncbi:MAG: DUF1587 domain-containing protein, partial [Verrucomicrobiae bacterium]|nr:DUF1587 domain-containing protein [Verrucomicrobiae bacterium]